MKILITGFDPFGGETVNPAYEAVRRLPAQIAGADIATVEIPVVYKKGPAAVEAAIDDQLAPKLREKNKKLLNKTYEIVKEAL